MTHTSSGSNVRDMAEAQMIRASITPDEWRRIRAIAILEDKDVQDLIAELIRERLAKRKAVA